jgi:hypothetical protein
VTEQERLIELAGIEQQLLDEGVRDILKSVEKVISKFGIKIISGVQTKKFMSQYHTIMASGDFNGWMLLHTGLTHKDYTDQLYGSMRAMDAAKAFRKIRDKFDSDVKIYRRDHVEKDNVAITTSSSGARI